MNDASSIAAAIKGSDVVFGVTNCKLLDYPLDNDSGDLTVISLGNHVR